MSKLLTMLTAGALALTLSGFAVAADKAYDSQQAQASQPADPATGGATTAAPAMSEKASTQQATDPAAGGATVSQSEQEYLAALTKCESLTGAEKTTCVEAAKKKSGQM